MAHARQQHPNAVLTPTGRPRMVVCVVEHGWTIEAAAERFQVDAKTVRKWRDRFLHEGSTGCTIGTLARLRSDRGLSAVHASVWSCDHPSVSCCTDHSVSVSGW